MLEHGGDGEPGALPVIKRTPRAPGKRATTPRRAAADEARVGQMQTVGRLVPACPMTADELAEQWEVAADDVETITVKVLRLKPGTEEMHLVDSPPLMDYDGSAIARNFGPGTYYIRPGGRKYAKNSAKLPISEALARSCGFGRIPTTAADVAAERTLREATQGPVDPVNLLSAIEAILDRRDRERGIQPTIPGVQPMMANPMQAMETQFEQLQRMMAFMTSMEERAIKTVEMRMGKQDFSPSAEDTNSSLLEKLLPKALDIFGTMMQNRQPAPVAVPQAPPVYPVQHQVSQAAQPVIAVKPAEQPQGVPMPQLTEDEQKAIAPALMMLKPYGSMIVDMAAQVADDDAIVAELEPWIPGGMMGSLETLSIIVAKHGPALLTQIHPGLGTDRWVGILAKLVEVCRG